MGYLLGLITGIIVGLLIAPERGDVTREELRQRSEELRRRADELADRAKRISEDAQVRTQKLIDDARTQLREVRGSDGGRHEGSVS